jgi:cyclopropane fatty-acyl-phospholipid synthase-like methyltransferase
LAPSWNTDLAPLIHSEASERNRAPILRVLAEAFRDCRSVLEIGSGTGQHAVYFARHLPHLTWQPTELADGLADLAERIELEGSANLRMPITLDVRAHPWPTEPVEAIFTANTCHIMDWDSVEHFYRGVGEVLKEQGVLCVYGPFRYRDAFTTASNADFDRYLRARDPASGIRDFEAVNRLAQAEGLALVEDHQMPANNQALVWERPGRSAGLPVAR